jgi:membrane-bound metal-dependent hydrolase YbcI (DUF457 family)
MAFATFFPEAVRMAVQDQSYILVWGGIGGILPDTLDFKLARFIEVFDIEVDPVANDPLHRKVDPQTVANELARAIDWAWRERRPVSIMLHTVKLGADAWQQYRLFFDREGSRVRVTVGPVVTTSKVPIYTGEDEPVEEEVAYAPVKAKMWSSYEKENQVDIFSGPSFEMVPKAGGVDIQFLGWHRRWSHALTVAAVGGVAVGLAFQNPLYGIIFGGGMAVHILEDQGGFMGSNLFYPFTRERSNGIHLFHSAKGIPNFTACYLAVVLMIWNLNRFAQQPAFSMPHWQYVLYAFFVPMAVIYFVAWLWREPREKAPSEGTAVTEETVEESEDQGGGA